MGLLYAATMLQCPDPNLQRKLFSCDQNIRLRGIGFILYIQLRFGPSISFMVGLHSIRLKVGLHYVNPFNIKS